MYSMTGYAVTSLRLKKLHIKIQIRSVNHRFLNLQINLPDVLMNQENQIKRLIQKFIRRGAINLSVKISPVSSQPAFDFNIALLKKYVQKLRAIQQTLALKQNLDLSTLIGFPGVMEPINSASQFTRADLARIKQMIEKVLLSLVQMRQREGNRLSQKLQQTIHRMQGLIQKIKKRLPIMLDNYQSVLRKRIKNLTTQEGFEPSDNLQQKLAEEVVLLAQRSDITEELHRLDSHLKEFIQSMKRETEVGKKLDFLSQECLREINTISTKANDSQIAHWVVALKSEVERLKEQVQNLE